MRIPVQSSSEYRFATSREVHKLLEVAGIVVQGGAFFDDDIAILVNDSDTPMAVALLEQAAFNVKMPASK